MEIRPIVDALLVVMRAAVVLIGLQGVRGL
jgi:hypothetical protein